MCESSRAALKCSLTAGAGSYPYLLTCQLLTWRPDIPGGDSYPKLLIPE